MSSNIAPAVGRFANLLADLRPIRVLHLYPRDMNINGDYGNLLTLIRRMQWRNVPVERIRYNPGDAAIGQADLIFAAGGEISENTAVTQDILRIKEQVNRLVDEGAAALALGGSYQLFGHEIRRGEKPGIPGLGVFDAHSLVAPDSPRLVGKVVATSEQFGQIVAFANHATQMVLGQGVQPLAQVNAGKGNNLQDNTEGVRCKNAIGSYLCGPLLPKNPRIADFLIAKAIEHRSGKSCAIDDLPALPEVDALAVQAADIARSRP